MRMRRRRPLLGAAMIGGTAYVAGKSRAQGAQREADQEARIEELEAQQAPPYAPPPPAAAAPPPPAAGGLTEQLTQLAQLREAGVLTPDEFEAAKAKLLAP
jgi:hypothetical protein